MQDGFHWIIARRFNKNIVFAVVVYGRTVKEVSPLKFISEREFNARMKKIQAENLSKERLRKLKAEKAKGKTKRKLPSTSKLILLGVILLCVQIVFFCEHAMMTLYDASSMYVLIGIPAALAPIIWGYYSKSKAENTQGGIVYDSAMEELRIQHEAMNSDSGDTESGGVG